MSEDRGRALSVRRWVHDINHFSWICNGERHWKVVTKYGIVSEEKGKRVMDWLALRMSL